MKEKKTDNFLVYLKTLLLVSVLNLLTRLLSAVSLSKLWGLEYEVEKYLGFLPVLSYSESNVVLFKKISTLSLIAPSVVIFAIFLYVAFAKKYESSERKDVAMNCWYIGMFLTLLQYAFALLLDQRVQFANDWKGILVVLILVCSSSFVYFYKTKK